MYTRLAALRSTCWHHHDTASWWCLSRIQLEGLSRPAQRVPPLCDDARTTSKNLVADQIADAGHEGFFVVT